MSKNELESLRWIKGDELTAIHLDGMAQAIIDNNTGIEEVNTQLNALSKNIQSAALNPYSRHVPSDIGDVTEGNKAYYNSGYEIADNPVGVNVNIDGSVGTTIDNTSSEKSLGNLAACDVGKWIVKKIVTDKYGNVNCTDIGVYDADSVPTSTMWRGNAQIDRYGYFYTRIAKIVESESLVTASSSSGTVNYTPVVVPFNTNDTPLPIVTVPAKLENRTTTYHTVPVIKYNLQGNSVIAKNITNKGGLQIELPYQSSVDAELDEIVIKSGIEFIQGCYYSDTVNYPTSTPHFEPQPYDVNLRWPITIRNINPDCSSSSNTTELSLHLESMDGNNWQIGAAAKGSLTIENYLPPILKAGENITLTKGTGREITISASSSSGGGGDVPLAQYNNAGTPNASGIISGIQVSYSSGTREPFIRDGMININKSIISPVQLLAVQTNHGIIYQDITSITTKQKLASTDIALDCNVTLTLTLSGKYTESRDGFRFYLDAVKS